MQFGKRINAARKRNGLTTQELAEKCGVSRSYITLIERGQRLPGAKTLPRIAPALDLKASVVLNWYLEDIRMKLQDNLMAE